MGRSHKGSGLRLDVGVGPQPMATASVGRARRGSVQSKRWGIGQARPTATSIQFSPGATVSSRRHRYSTDDAPLPPGVMSLGDAGPIGRVRAASHDRREERRFGSDGRCIGTRISGVVSWDEDPATEADWRDLARRWASVGERLIAFVVAIWHITITLFVFGAVLFIGAAIGTFADPRGYGSLIGLGVGLLFLILVGAWSTYDDHL